MAMLGYRTINNERDKKSISSSFIYQLPKSHRLDIILSSALISSCEKAAKWPSALHFFGQTGRELHLQPNEITCGAIISSYEKGAKWQEATEIFFHPTFLSVETIRATNKTFHMDRSLSARKTQCICLKSTPSVPAIGVVSQK